ncbi:MAG: hypothetical protein LBP43_04640, partial [Treponema sp.]|nr:hypothetical protein [Treponema sp.]
PRGEERDLKKTEAPPVESGDTPAEKPAARGASSVPDLSTQLLMKIVEELSSIRVELSNLKQEFRVLRTEGSGEGPGESQGHGFFDEEDDEKISLTGDELDTILHTTDFTEETGKEDSVDLSLPEEQAETLVPVEEQEPEVSAAEPDDFVFEDDKIPENSEDSISIDLDFDLDEVSLEALKETEPVSEEQKPEEEISLDSGEFEIPLEIGDELDLSGEDNAGLSLPEENPEFSLDPENGELILDPAETAELELLMEKGVEPMTPPPEDTSYLDEEPLLAEDSFAGISLDLSDAVIDEPDLSGKITENPPEEPALENIILDDLSVDELSEDISVTFDTREDEEEEIRISLPEELPEGEIQEEEIQEADDFSPVIPEAFEEKEKDSPASFEEDLPEETIVEDALPDILEENAPGEEESLFDETGPEKAEELKTGDAGQNNETYYSAIPSNLQQELKTVLSYMDQLLESLPEEKIEEFAKSEYFDTYKKLFKELGLV